MRTPLLFALIVTLAPGPARAADPKARPTAPPDPGALTAEARKVLAPGPEHVLQAARKIPREASAADVKAATARLGPPLLVEYSRCKAGSGECTAAPEAEATSRIEAWGVEGRDADTMLLVTSCKVPGGWKAGRVRVTAQPRPKGPAKVLHDEIAAEFFRATCWR